jgi:predicted component of type VI protein secretion system
MVKSNQRNGAQINVPFLYRFLTEGKVDKKNYIQSVEEELARLLEARVSYVKDEDRLSILNYGLTDNFFTDLSNNEERFLKEKKLEELIKYFEPRLKLPSINIKIISGRVLIEISGKITFGDTDTIISLEFEK